jgi:hypothetical protein
VRCTSLRFTVNQHCPACFPRVWRSNRATIKKKRGGPLRNNQNRGTEKLLPRHNIFITFATDLRFEVRLLLSVSPTFARNSLAIRPVKHLR